ncbi:MAG: 30S ribosomal protein S6 [Mariprofundaceae bacterium]
MYYETIFIVNPDVSQGNAEELTDNLVPLVEKAGGRVVKREYWGTRTLAYSITKRKRGHYTLLVVDGEAKAVNALERALGLDETVMRFLTTRLNELSDEPSPLYRRRIAVTEATPAEAEKETTESEEKTEIEEGADAKSEAAVASTEITKEVSDVKESSDSSAETREKAVEKDAADGS